MSESNIKKLKNAYRHPFEYISPLLYRKKFEITGNGLEGDEFELKATEIYCGDEDHFNELFRAQAKYL